MKKLFSSSLLLASVLSAFPAKGEVEIVKRFFNVDPAGTYLPVQQENPPHLPTRVNLVDIDPRITAGTVLTMREVGGFSTAPGYPDGGNFGLTGVFVDQNGNFLSKGEISNAPDSITDPIDIPQDFLLGLVGQDSAPAISVQVPVGAVAILFTPGDGYIYWDNSDPDHDYGVYLEGPVPAQTPDGSPDQAPCPNKGCLPNPVNIASGAMWHSQEDFFVPGRTPDSGLQLLRTYLAHSDITKGRFGIDWQDNFGSKIFPSELSGNSATPDLVWVDENGAAYTYKRQSDGTYVAPAGYRNRLLEFSDHFEVRTPNKKAFFYSKSGLLTAISERHGETVTLAYDSNVRLTTVTSPFAGSVTFTYNSRGLVSQAKRNRDNLTYSYTYNSDDRLVSVTDFSGRTYQFTYISGSTNIYVDGKMDSITDPIGRVTRYEYDSKGRVSRVSEPGGGFWDYKYGNLRTAVKHPNGEIWQYYFDTNHHTLKTLRPDGSVETNIWTNGFITSTYLEQGGQTKFTYDADGNISSIKRPNDSAAKLISYDPNFNIPYFIQPVVGASFQLTIDQNSGDVSQMSRVGLALNFTYDAFGNVLSTGNGKTSYSQERNANGLITGVFDLHNPETRTYDAHGRLATQHWASGRTVSYSYNNYDHVLSQTDSNGPSVNYTYDDAERMVQKSVSAGGETHTTQFQYDDRDRIISTTDAMGRVTRFSYDPISIRDKPIAITDPAGRVTHFYCDKMDRLVKKVDALGAETKFTYNQYGSVTSVTDALGHVTRYYYDLNNRKIREVRPSVAGTTAVERVCDYFYDSADHLVREVTHSVAGPADRTIIYSYDSLDRLIRKVVQREGSSGAVVEDDSNFTYESQLDASLLKTAVNGVASLGFSNEAAPPFASSGFSVAASQSGNPLGLIEGSFGISRDVTGEIASVSKNGTNLFTKAYDPAGRLTGVQAGSFSMTIGYDSFGNKASVSHSTGESGTFQRDLLERLTQITWTGPTPISETLGYDPLSGNITTIARENGAYTLAYDAVDQLVSSTGAYNHSITYDALGNRAQSSINGAGSFVNNFLVSNGQSSFLSDPDGFGDVIRETSGAVVKNYFFRADDRLSGYSDSSSQVAYYYDPLGRRVAKVFNGTVGSFSQTYTHLGVEHQILQAKAGDGTITTFLEGQHLNEHLGEYRSGTYKGYITDHLGSVLNSEAAGSAHSFGLFGETVSMDLISSGSNPAIFGFTGHTYLQENGNYFTSPRLYNPQVGRWNAPEPFGLDGPNRYWYANNSPSKFVDFNGFSHAAPEGGAGYLPEVPPGVDIEKNIEEAKKMSPLEFKRAVESKGKWDYKRQGKKYEAFGNYHYGVVGRAAGFCPDTLKRAAGAYQIYSGTSDPSFGKPWDLNSDSSYGDDPSDQANIEGGIWDYENGNTKKP